MKILNMKEVRLLVLALGLLLSACQADGNQVKENTDTVATVQAPQPVEDTIENYELFFQDVNGKKVSLSSLKGKVVFINFWATWCPPCIREIPSINKLAKHFAKDEGIVFLMVEVDGDFKKATAFMRKNKFNLSIYAPAGDIPKSLLGSAIPTTVIFNREGQLVTRVEGARDYGAGEVIAGLTELIKFKK